jgi:hypothetical protein
MHHPGPILFCNLWMEPPGPTKPLHEFSKSIIAPRSSYSNFPGSVPHFRLTKMLRERAIKAGAVEVKSRAILKALVAWRRHRGEFVQESKCCFAGVTVAGKTTQHYVCNACLEPCDLV